MAKGIRLLTLMSILVTSLIVVQANREFTGPCKGGFPRFYFDKVAGICKNFTYGGCKGNENNFETMDACQAKCVDICQLPEKKGPCSKSLRRFYFDKVAGECKKFTYGGCEGNANNFKTLKMCKRKCVDICQLPEKKGPCSESLQHFYFDKVAGECKKFTYGGCKGNANNFKTRKVCQMKCVDICKLPEKKGPCNKSLRRFYFDKVAGECKKFTYGGCKGNANNFKTLKACQKKCLDICQLPKKVGPCNKVYFYFDKVDGDCKNCKCGGCKGHTNIFETIEACQASFVDICQLPKEVGPCKAAFPRFHFDKDAGECKSFTYGGCKGNANNFETMEACKANCSDIDVDIGICQLPKEVGPCKVGVPRFYFDKDTGKCKNFNYGGCGGNANNFKTMEACKANCSDIDVDIDICQLPEKVGPCMAAFPRFYFDKDAGECKSFIYGGCKGNANNFKTMEACQANCSDINIDVCHLPKKVGPCKGAVLRFYFDKDTGQCKSFTYGGCKGNANNFKTMEDCKANCSNIDVDIDACQLPKEVGPCEVEVPRFFFDKDTGNCKNFTYGGCGGNANNFETMEACKANCSDIDVDIDICQLPKEVGPCRLGVPRFFFDKETGKCKNFTYGGCKGNANNFETMEACKANCSDIDVDIDICHLPKEVGACKVGVPRFYFDKDAGECKNFSYGGCGGNANNFESMEACKANCSEVEIDIDICQLPKEVGPCKAAVLRFYFDKHAEECKSFIYGGCKGNANNFETMEGCKVNCSDIDVDISICQLPKDVGPCKAAFPRFFFDKDAGQCKNFAYGGCKGNANNFKTMEACKANCLDIDVDIDICQLPKEVGPCKGAVPRFYFDKDTGECKNFTYGGCGGNANNFETMEACKANCSNIDVDIDICQWPKEVGPCTEGVPRFSFDKDTGECKKFTYCGCGGNANIFATMEACKAKCADVDVDIDICQLRKEVGPCKEAFSRFFFDKDVGVCKNFTYGGCNGNANNFETIELCQDKCEQ